MAGFAYNASYHGLGSSHRIACCKESERPWLFLIPTLGLRLERRAMLARGTDGRPVLWTQRRRLPLLAPPAPKLRFDVLQEEAAPVS